MTSIQRTAFLTVTLVLAGGCRTGPRCGDLRYDPDRNACTCHDGSTFDPEAGVCVADPAPDGCVPDDETCNGFDDDCDGDVDEAPILGCAVPSGALEAQCTAGECAITRCESGHEDCNGEFTNGCEVDVSSDARTAARAARSALGRARPRLATIRSTSTRAVRTRAQSGAPAPWCAGDRTVSASSAMARARRG